MEDILAKMKETTVPLHEKEKQNPLNPNVSPKQVLNNDMLSKMKQNIQINGTKKGPTNNTPTPRRNGGQQPQQAPKQNSGGLFDEVSKVQSISPGGGMMMNEGFDDDREFLMQKEIKRRQQEIANGGVPKPDIMGFGEKNNTSQAKPQQGMINENFNPQPQQRPQNTQQPSGGSSESMTVDQLQFIKKLILSEIKEELQPMIKDMVKDEIIRKFLKKELLSTLKEMKK